MSVSFAKIQKENKNCIQNMLNKEILRILKKKEMNIIREIKNNGN